MGCGLSTGRQISPAGTGNSLEMITNNNNNNNHVGMTDKTSVINPAKPVTSMGRLCAALSLKLWLPCRFYQNETSTNVETNKVPFTSQAMQTESDIVGFKLQHAQTDSQVMSDEELEAMIEQLEGEMKKIEEECNDQNKGRGTSELEHEEDLLHKTWKNIVKTQGETGFGGERSKVNIAVQATRPKATSSTQTKFGEVDHRFVPNAEEAAENASRSNNEQDLFTKTLTKVMAGDDQGGMSLDEHLNTLLTSFNGEEDDDGEEECPNPADSIVNVLKKTLSSFDSNDGTLRDGPPAEKVESIQNETKDDNGPEPKAKEQNNKGGGKGKLKYRLSLMKQQKFNTRLQMLMEEMKAQNALEHANVKKRDVSLQTTNDILTDEGPEFAARSPLCHKNEMIPSSLMFREIDKKVQEIPQAIEDVHAIVDAVAAFAKNDLFKIRAMFVWITNNIKFDYAYEGSECLTANEIIARGRGTSKDYSHLFAELGRLLGIRVKKLSGFVRMPDFRPGYRFRIGHDVQHYWNAVYVLSSWRFVDAALAAGTVDGLGEFHHSMSEHYFLTDPNIFIWSHFPYDELEENYERWQLLDKPFSLDQFNTLPKVTEHFFEYSLSIRSRFSVSPLEFRISTEVKIGAHEAMRYKYKFYSFDEIENGSLNNYVFCQLKEDRLVGSFMVSPPLEGRYLLKVFAKPEREMHGSQQDLGAILNPVATFALDCTKARKYIEPYPLNELPWGATQKFYDFKIKLVNQKGPIVVTWGGKRRLVLESNDVMLMTHSLFDAESMEMDTKSIVSRDDLGTRITFTVNPPRVGTFKFMLFGMPKPKQKGKWRLPLLATFMIDCKLIKPVVHDEDTPAGNGTVAAAEENKAKKK